VESIMSAAAASSPGITPSNGSGRGLVARRIRFLAEAPPGARVLRTFTQPRPCVAVDEAADPGDLPAVPAWPEPTDQLVVLFVPRGASPDGQRRGERWLAPPDHPEASAAVVVERDGYTVQWRPGRALVLGKTDGLEDALGALADLAFYEGELRELERALTAHEAAALDDVARSYRIRYRDRDHWARLGESIEALGRMRLTFARLKPRLGKPARLLPAEARRLLARLRNRADVEARLEAFSDRLEACEDLYEGATDRVADFRWYIGGHGLEIGIIALLVVEILLMSAELYLRFREVYPG
jgi:hypothetical protein